jgi:hypothetical protein
VRSAGASGQRGFSVDVLDPVAYWGHCALLLRRMAVLRGRAEQPAIARSHDVPGSVAVTDA